MSSAISPETGVIQSPRAGRTTADLKRAAFLRWLRKAHGWLGLWGAVLGFLFGATGILLAHRSVLKIPISKGEQTVVQYKLAQMPATAADLGVLISKEFDYADRPPRIKVEKSRPVAWNSVGVQQPERWELNFNHPSRAAKVEYFVGNSFARVEKYDATVIGTMARLHMATGVDAYWVLLLDSIAASLMLLALTGTLLWTQLKLPRMGTAAVIVGAPVLAAVWFAANL